MIQTATLIPTHKDKFHWAKNFLESYLNNVEQPHNLYFIFTDEIEAESFSKITKFKEQYTELILPFSLRNKKSIINVKKYFGLFSIKEKYDYIGVFDCESEFVAKCNLNQIYEDIGELKYFKANKAKKGKEIIKSIAEKLKLDYNKNLLEQTQYYSVYWWFNEIPVYKMEYFREFIDWFYFKFDNTEEVLNDYYCFDFLVYSIWLICFKDFKINTYETNIDFECGAVEEFRIHEEDKNKITKLFNSYWSTNFSNYNKFKKVKLLFQIDNR